MQFLTLLPSAPDYVIHCAGQIAHPSTVPTDVQISLKQIQIIGNVLEASYKLDVAGVAKGAIVHRYGSYSAGATTPSVSGATILIISNSSSTTITNFTDGVDGQVIYLYFIDSNTTINRSNCYLAGGSVFVSTFADMLVLVKSGTYWYEISRSANS